MKRNGAIFENFRKYVKEADIIWLLLLPPLIAMIIVIGGALLAPKFFPLEVPSLYTSILIFIAGMITGVSGLIQIIRREMPGPIGGTIRGKYPVISGFLWIIMFWGLGIFVLITDLLGI